MMSKKCYLIVGLGLIGGSYAKGLHKKGHKILAISKNMDDIRYAMEEGFVDDGSDTCERRLFDQADEIILALYPSQEADWIKENQSLIRPGTVIMDVAGVKGCVVNRIQEILRSDLEFLATHPMAGREVSGVRNADETIFRKANYIIVPTETNSERAVKCAEAICRDLEFARCSTLSVERHDEIIGFVSQLTHVLAIALMTCNEDEDLQNYTGDSFRDLTRIARINENMWTELFIENKTALISQIEDFRRQLVSIEEMILQEDTERLKEVMKASTARRSLFDKK